MSAAEAGGVSALAGKRECFAGQRDRAGRVLGKHVVSDSDGELDGGLGEIAAGPGDVGGLFGERAASANARRVLAMFCRAEQTVSSTGQCGVPRRALASVARRQSSSAAAPSARMEVKISLTARASG
jgi:hypothetical protein